MANIRFGVLIFATNLFSQNKGGVFELLRNTVVSPSYSISVRTATQLSVAEAPLLPVSVGGTPTAGSITRSSEFVGATIALLILTYTLLLGAVTVH